MCPPSFIGEVSKQRRLFPKVRLGNQCCGSDGLYMLDTDFFFTSQRVLVKHSNPEEKRYEYNDRKREKVSSVQLSLEGKEKEEKKMASKHLFRGSPVRDTSVCIFFFASARGRLSSGDHWQRISVTMTTVIQKKNSVCNYLVISESSDLQQKGHQHRMNRINLRLLFV